MEGDALMNDNIDFNPKYKDPAKYDWGKDLNTLEGYESPISLYIQQIANKIEERRENEVISTISERLGVEINKDELAKALTYDRNQYSEGFRAGYERALFDLLNQNEEGKEGET